MAGGMGTLRIKCSITTGGGPLVKPMYISQFIKKKNASHNLFRAVTFETASASLLLHLTCGPMACPSAVGVSCGRGEFDILLVNSWGMLGSCE